MSVFEQHHSLLVARIISSFGRMYSLLLVAIFWEIGAFLINDALLLPRLSDVIVTLGVMLAHGPLLADAWISLIRVLGGFVVALLLGLPLGVLMGWFRQWDDFWGSLVSFSNPIPKIALVPLFLLWFGIGESAKIAVIAAGAFFPIVINTYNAVHSVKPIWVWRARTVGIGKLEILYKVILPAALPGIFTGARLGMSLAWVILIAAEMVAAQSGLGFRILYGQQMFQTNVVFAGILSISAIGFAFDRLIQWLSYRCCSWHFRLRQGNDSSA